MSLRAMNELSTMRILIADDDPAAVRLLEQLLDDAGYGEVLSTSVASLDAMCAIARVELVILGLPTPARVRDALRRERAQRGADEIPLLLVGGRSAAQARRAAIALGARDFLTRPIDRELLLLRVGNLLHIRRLQRELERRADVLDQAVRERTLKVEQARLETLRILASVAEFHDDETRQHAQRVGLGAAMIAQELGLPELLVRRIRDAAALHDIGKIGISRRVLLKPGTLTPAERENMMRHVEIGARILAAARSPVLRLAAEIARTHHEHWDGRGYLAGLRGEEIPLSGRITAVADVFDALIHHRPYRAAWDPDLARAEIAAQAGRQFDPRVVAAFARIDHDRLIRDVRAEEGQPAAEPHRAPVAGQPDRAPAPAPPPGRAPAAGQPFGETAASAG